MKSENNVKKLNILTFFKAFLITLVLVCAFFGVYFTSFEHPTARAEETEQPASTYSFGSMQDFIDYATAYASGARNPKDTLRFAIVNDAVICDSNYTSNIVLGSSSRPFAGTFVLPASGVDTFELYDVPLFDYVSTDFTISGASSLKIRRKHKDFSYGSLFANHVVEGANAANWTVELVSHEGEGFQSTAFEGVIGDIAENCDVTMSFTKTATAAEAFTVSRANNAGLICGTLNAGASLKVATAGSASAVSVTATSGHAGGLVGEMKAGAKLRFDSANNSRVNSVTATSGYAGGVVGKVNDVTAADDFSFKAGVTDYTVSGTINGNSGAGGLFGYYKNSYVTYDGETESVVPTVFTLNNTFAITSGTTVSSNKYTGGVFGLLENTAAKFTFDGNGSGSEVFNVSLTDGTARGGMAGAYSANALSNTFTVSNFKPTVSTSSMTGSGGVIGSVIGGNAAYILIDGGNSKPIEVTISGGVGGGLIGNLGDAGSFADVTGNIKISGTANASLINSMTEGVLRIAGLTDLSSYIANTSTNAATFVQSRDRALVYALGNGSDSGWTVKRRLNNAYDDIGSWGQVVRVTAAESAFDESDLFSVDMTEHTVTVKAPEKSMGTPVDFAKTALNIQLNTPAAKGALAFADTTNVSSSLLSGDLSLSADISLVGTGITGLTRDGGSDNAILTFKGTFNGNNHTLTFSTGESYGLDGSGNALASDSKQGNIYKHAYNGLFAKVNGDNANKGKIYDLKLSGNFYVNQTESGVRLGGAAAEVSGYCTISNVDANFTVRLVSNDVSGYYGGVIGFVSGGATVSVTSGSGGISPTVNDNGTNTGNNNSSYIGGVIGYVGGSASQSITFESGSKIGLTYTKTSKNARTSVFGAAIAGVGSKEYVKGNRNIIFENSVTVNISANGASANNKRFGGILGCSWYAADVSIDNLVVASASVTANANANFGGLVQTATGYWDIDSITLTSANFNLPGGTFGFVANKTFNNPTEGEKSALYLDVDNTGSNYNIGALTFTGTHSFSTFDEIVADSRFDSNDIANNGNSIVSITVSDSGVFNTSGTANTYKNKTTYGAEKINPYTRYYYNLAYARTHTATPKFKFLVWSVKSYAHTSLSAWFNETASFSGDLDMTGLSYYPVDLRESVTFNNASIKLDNVLTETWVSATDASNSTRTTRSNTNQHYLMHTAVFRNASAGDITITGTTSGLTLGGNVPKLSDDFCGFLVAGTLGGSDSRNEKFNASKIVFDGAHIVSNAGADITTAVYAPLLINKVGKNTTLTISAAEQSTALTENGETESKYGVLVGASKYAASSLIGDVGNATARAIYLTFTGLKFDGRSSATTIGNLDTAYGTSKSIFSRATVLNSFVYAGESSGTYNFTFEEEGWYVVDPETEPPTRSAVHNVTYGKEIKSSVEFSGQQQKYYGSEYYTHPTSYQSASEYNFSSGFLPYVYDVLDNGVLITNHHEIKVNVYVTTDAIEGCGKYGDPYIIVNGTQLEFISRIIQGAAGNISGSIGLTLPATRTPNSDCTPATDYVYYFDGESSSFTSAGHSAVLLNNVRDYLAGAYYVITKDITLSGGSTGFISLGSSDGAQYAFRGVIIGRGITITNNSDQPLIKTSMGAVIKDLTVDVAVTKTADNTTTNVITLPAPTGSAVYSYGYTGTGNIRSYGAVIEQILGGDTIIDNVNVTFSDVGFAFTANETSTFSRLVPVGGYVGSLVNGGLVFRNMKDEDENNYTGLTNSVCNLVNNNEGYLYVNPFIGRVLAGFAFYETDVYSVVSSTVDNGVKNYTISDLAIPAEDEDKLGVEYTAANVFTITVPDGQAMFVLGAIVNSGAGSASRNASTEQPYQSLSDYWLAYREYTTARADATYDFVGKTEIDGYSADFTKAQSDAYTANRTKIPYIVRAYTLKDGSVYAARSISTYTSNVVNVTGDCNVAAGFRGIGSIYLDSNYVRLRISKMSGQIGETQDSYQITLNMRYLEYNHKFVTSYIAYAANNSQNTMAGFGLFTKLIMTSASSTNCVQYLELSGSVFYDVYRIADGVRANYTFANVANGSTYDRPENGNIRATSNHPDTEDVTIRRTILSVGGLAGLVTANCYIKNVTFNDLSVEGAKSAGGLLGYVFTNNSLSCTIKYEDNVRNAGYVNVVGGLQSGGLIGRIYKSPVFIEGASGSGTDIIVKTIESKNLIPNETEMAYFANINTGVGGIVGNCWGSDKTASNRATARPSSINSGDFLNELHITNINVVKSNNYNAFIRVNNDDDNYDNYAGGFVGSAHYVYVKIENSNLKGVNVSANSAGGFIGKLTQHYYIEIIGCAANGNSNAAISGTRFAGGAVGWAIGRDMLYFQLLNFSVENYVIESTTTGENIAGAGGCVGYAEGNNKPTNDSNNRICQFNNISVLSCEIITNYSNNNINTNNRNYKCGTGGIIGVIDTIVVSGKLPGANGNTDGAGVPDELSGSRNSDYKYKFSGYNILVKDCTLTHLNGGSSDDSTSSSNRRIGDIVGNNAISTPLKLVGVSVENTGYIDNDETVFCGKHVGYCDSDNNNYGSGGTYGTGYVVFANVKAAIGNERFSGLRTALKVGNYYYCLATDSDGAMTKYNLSALQNASGLFVRDESDPSALKIGDYYYRPVTGSDSAATKYNITVSQNNSGLYVRDYVEARYPFATVNPYITFENGLILTGDGVADSVADLPIQKILNDESGFYDAAGAYYTGSSGDTNKEAFESYIGKFAMFKSEASGYLGTDFPILILDDNTPANSHRMINSYLRLLTNTRHDFGVDAAGEYNVVIYNMLYDDNDDEFKPSSTDASLKRYGGQFYMLNTSIDSGKMQFSLIDVRFLDPADTSQVAYHLYVPVFVKKVMTYRFDIAVQSGTTYYSDQYEDDFGAPMIENIGTPVTFYFRYIYSRGSDSWTDAINSGENLNRNYAKKLTVSKVSSSGDIDDFDADTILVLVDKNNGDKPYYAKWGSVLTNGVLNLGAFMETMTFVDGDYVFGGNSFVPVNLDQLLDLSAVANASGLFVRCDSEDDEDLAKATVKVGDYYYRLADGDDGALQKYAISVGADSLEESYYLTAFTDANAYTNEFIYYLFSSPSSFNVAEYPSRIDTSEGARYVHLIMGKIFDHAFYEDAENEIFGLVSSAVGGEMMSAVNNTLNVTMNVKLGLSTSLANDVRSSLQLLMDSTDVYQSFIVYLNRKVGSTTTRAIIGDPEASGTYSVNGGSPNAYTGNALNVNGNFAEFISGDLSSLFATGNFFYVSADVSLVYSSSAVFSQFPERRSEGSSENGVTVTASSNIAFSQSATSYSKNTDTAIDHSNETYYTMPDQFAQLYLDPIGDSVGDCTPLGINAYGNATGSASFDLYAVLEVTDIADAVENYSRATVNITLSQRQNNATYGDPLDLRDYLTLTLDDVFGNVTYNNETKDYSVNVLKTEMNQTESVEGATIVLPILKFNVKTGDAFEEDGLTYGNYRITVSIILSEIVDGVYTDIAASSVSNYIIYTNAKVIPDFVEYTCQQ